MNERQNKKHDTKSRDLGADVAENVPIKALVHSYPLCGLYAEVTMWNNEDGIDLDY